jgi:hypothetical protein
MAVATRTDPAGAYSWRIHDKVDQFRVWAGSRTYRLPAEDDHKERWLIGSDEDEGVWLFIPDESARISRRHAALMRDDAGWLLADLNSKNGTSLDGEALLKFIPMPVVPGAELRIGRLTLIAESPMLRELQEVLRRLIRWDDAYRSYIDAAQRSIRLATTRHEPLVLRAEDSHIVIARSLHSYIVGANRPFVVCERRAPAKSGAHKERTAPRTGSLDAGMEALAAATGGTLVVWKNRLPADFERVLDAVRDSERVLLIVCVQGVARGAQIQPQIVVPSLEDRAAELDRIIDAYAAEAPAEIRDTLTAEERYWVKSQPKLSLATIKTGTRRALAFRAADREVTRAAGLSDVEHGTLSTWLARRRDLPAQEIDDEDDDSDDDQW